MIIRVKAIELGPFGLVVDGRNFYHCRSLVTVVLAAKEVRKKIKDRGYKV